MSRPSNIPEELRLSMMRSVVAAEDPQAELDEALSWLQASRANPTLSVSRVGLAEVVAAEYGGTAVDEISLQSAVVFVRTVLKEREITEWTQPLIISEGRNFCGLVLTEREGAYFGLMQAIEEPGVIGSVQIGPSVQLGMSFVEPEAHGKGYLSLFEPQGRELFRVAHSEEGGRFFRDTITYAAVMTSDEVELLDARYRWISLAALKWGIELENVINIHARTLICML
jgi:dTDP-4-dehydro-6-deoxy-alpha-D-glucopyranose 2,3-dehydratase